MVLGGVFLYYTRVLKLLSWYLNTYADFIEPAIIEELVNECGLTKQEAFTKMLFGLKGTGYSKRSFFNLIIDTINDRKCFFR